MKKRLVKLTWYDATTDGGWQEADETADLEPDLCETVGYLIAETDLAYIIASTISGTQTNGRIIIPCGFVKSVEDFNMGLGPELVTNGAFASDTGWTYENSVGPGWEITGGVMYYDHTLPDGEGSSGDYVYQSVPLKSGASYLISYDLVINGLAFGDGTRIELGSAAGEYRTESGSYSEVIVFSGAQQITIKMGNVGAVGYASFDNVSIREVLEDIYAKPWENA